MADESEHETLDAPTQSELEHWLRQPKTHAKAQAWFPPGSVDLPPPAEGEGTTSPGYVTPPSYVSPIRQVHEVDEPVAQEDFPRDWPFTVPYGLVRLLVFNQIIEGLEYGPQMVLLFEDPDGTVYSASGSALSWAEDFGWEDPGPILLKPEVPTEKALRTFVRVAVVAFKGLNWDTWDQVSGDPTPLN